MLAGAALAAAIALLGVTSGSAIGARRPAQRRRKRAVLARGFGPYTDFADCRGSSGAVDCGGWSPRRRGSSRRRERIAAQHRAIRA